ncbi:MAG TPA: DUF4879 domain-containing protein [Syntrophomonas sp.]|jgi:hypothetical protein|nr:DUF4879 domain-containing protein [Syntrophomonas sp.]
MAKTKTSIVMILSLMICLFLSSGFVSAAESTLEKDLSLELPKIQDLSTDMDNSQVKQTDNGAVVLGSAPPLTDLFIYAAISSNYPQYEYFSRNQLRSVQDHGGAEMYIVTYERGYGQNRFARMDGDLLDMYDWLWFDDNGDNIYDGVYIWWDASGYPYGTFTYESTSHNYPWNKMSDSIYIK